MLESARGPFRGGAPRRNPERPGLLALPTGERLRRHQPRRAARVLESARGPFRGGAAGRAAGRPRLLAVSLKRCKASREARPTNAQASILLSFNRVGRWRKLLD